MKEKTSSLIDLMARSPNNVNGIYDIPVGTKLAYRIFPGDFPLTITTSMESSTDWSGFYAQFNLDHCLSYLPNRYDQGYAMTVLCSITTKLPMKAIVFTDPIMQDTKVSSLMKANAVRDYLWPTTAREEGTEDRGRRRQTAASLPLLDAIGEVMEVPSVLVLYDHEDLEVVFPHRHLLPRERERQEEDLFLIEPLARFHRHDGFPGGTRLMDIFIGNSSNEGDEAWKQLSLRRDEQRDLSLLIDRSKAELLLMVKGEEEERLNINNSRSIAAIPLSFLPLSLQLQHPSCLLFLHHLHSLQWDHSELTEIPKGIFPLLADSLVNLTLHNNRLTSLPSDLCSLSRLQELRLDHNQLHSLPEDLGNCPQLQLLHLTNNPSLARLPDSIGQLHWLHHVLLEDTAIAQLPVSMVSCTSLQFIVASAETLVSPPPEVWQQMNGLAIRDFLASIDVDDDKTTA